MPRKAIPKEEEFEDETPMNTPEEEDIDIEEELEKARVRMKNRKQIDKEVDGIAKSLKKERLQLQKEVAGPSKRKGRFEKDSEEAKEWAKKMQEAKAKKREERETAARIRLEEEEAYEEKLRAAQKAKMKAVEKKLAKYEAAASEDMDEPVAPKASRKKKVVQEQPLPPAHKVVAEDVVAKEKERMQRELMVKRMRSVIPNFPQ